MFALSVADAKPGAARDRRDHASPTATPMELTRRFMLTVHDAEKALDDATRDHARAGRVGRDADVPRDVGRATSEYTGLACHGRYPGWNTDPVSPWT